MKKEKLKINKFGRTFDNIDLELLYESVKSKTLLENSNKYEDQNHLSLRMSTVSSIGKFKITSSEPHINPIEPL